MLDSLSYEFLPRNFWFRLGEDISVILTLHLCAFTQGVMITHGNLIATAAGVMKVIPKLNKNDVYIAYLPLAHVFELEAEVFF